TDARAAQANYLLVPAYEDALMGARSQAISEADAALRLSRDHASLDSAAQAYAMAGDTVRAEAVIAELERSTGSNSSYRLINLPIDHALVALARNQPAAALTLVAPLAPYAPGGDAQGGPFYVSAMALLAQQQPAAAALAFQKMLALPTEVEAYPAAQLGLARAQAQSGNTAAARATYQSLLAQWKDADSGLPLVEAARAEYAALAKAR
ncbi:MAG: hypothetical protein ACRD1E_12110, partial [Terriglobales bacterium]